MALDCGMASAIFWEMSIAEVADYLASYNRTKRQQMKEEIAGRFSLAERIAENVQLVLLGSNKVKLQTMQEKYPDIFIEEIEEYKKNQGLQELEDYKAKRREWARRHNENMKRKEDTNEELRGAEGSRRGDQEADAGRDEKGNG